MSCTLRFLFVPGTAMIGPAPPMNLPTIEEIREKLNASKVEAGALQHFWRSRAKVPWLQEKPLAQRFVKRALQQGELILACDSAKESLEVHQDDPAILRILANALAEMGSTRKARVMLRRVLELGHRDVETLSLIARTYKDDWNHEPDPYKRAESLQKAHDQYLLAYQLPSNDPSYPGINAASTACLLGQTENARKIAGEVLELCQAKAAKADYWIKATVAEALVVLGRYDEAREVYRSACAEEGAELRHLSSTRRQARLLAQHLFNDRAAFDSSFPGLHLVVFSGHMLDAPNRRTPRFPREKEAEIKREIAARLEKLDAKIGVASAAQGSDILFLEAMLERDGVIHVVLPWRREEFVETSVREAGPEWVERFERVLDRAASVYQLGELYMPSSAVGLEYCIQVMNGLAGLMARALDLESTPLAVWDGAPGRPGGTGSFVQYWKQQRRKVARVALPPPPFETVSDDANVGQASSDGGDDADERWVLDATRQEIRAMLFADIVGYSKLPEEKIPRFVAHFMRRVSQLIAQSEFAPIYANTWGDAVYFVFSRVEQAGNFALELRDLVLDTKWENYDLVWMENGEPRPLNIRIGLHAGPVYVNFDPVIRQLSFTGAHVSRAARIEPITLPGEVFCSEEFAALAAAENSQGFRCEFVGKVPLAKNYGEFRTYELRRTR